MSFIPHLQTSIFKWTPFRVVWMCNVYNYILFGWKFKHSSFSIYLCFWKFFSNYYKNTHHNEIKEYYYSMCWLCVKTLNWMRRRHSIMNYHKLQWIFVLNDFYDSRWISKILNKEKILKRCLLIFLKPSSISGEGERVFGEPYPVMPRVAVGSGVWQSETRTTDVKFVLVRRYNIIQDHFSLCDIKTITHLYCKQEVNLKVNWPLCLNEISEDSMTTSTDIKITSAD